MVSWPYVFEVLLLTTWSGGQRLRETLRRGARGEGFVGRSSEEAIGMLSAIRFF